MTLRFSPPLFRLSRRGESPTEAGHHPFRGDGVWPGKVSKPPPPASVPLPSTRLTPLVGGRGRAGCGIDGGTVRREGMRQRRCAVVRQRPDERVDTGLVVAHRRTAGGVPDDVRSGGGKEHRAAAERCEEALLAGVARDDRAGIGRAGSAGSERPDEHPPAVPTGDSLSVTVASSRASCPSVWKMPPPCQPTAVLPETVTLTRLASPRRRRPPPTSLAELPLTVERSMIVVVPKKEYTPPPGPPSTRLPDTALSTSWSVAPSPEETPPPPFQKSSTLVVTRLSVTSLVSVSGDCSSTL